MSCINIAGAVVCTADPAGYRKRYERCPTCECTTEFVVHYSFWHGMTAYCCRCGDSWTDEGRGYRPFARDWRRDAVARHRQLWDRATFGPPPSFKAELDAMQPGNHTARHRLEEIEHG